MFTLLTMQEYSCEIFSLLISSLPHHQDLYLSRVAQILASMIASLMSLDQIDLSPLCIYYFFSRCVLRMALVLLPPLDWELLENRISDYSHLHDPKAQLLAWHLVSHEASVRSNHNKLPLRRCMQKVMEAPRKDRLGLDIFRHREWVFFGRGNKKYT